MEHRKAKHWLTLAVGVLLYGMWVCAGVARITSEGWLQKDEAPFVMQVIVGPENVVRYVLYH